MKTITVSEFRKNIKKYADLAKTEKIIISRGEGKAFTIVPLEEVDDSGYNPEFVKKIFDRKNEPSIRIDTEKDLKEFLESL